jgi:hypothetical protein
MHRGGKEKDVPVLDALRELLVVLLEARDRRFLVAIDSTTLFSTRSSVQKEGGGREKGVNGRG